MMRHLFTVHRNAREVVMQATSGWPDAVEELFEGDHAVMLAYVTPASGVVLTPVTNFALHDRAEGTIAVNTSIGAWRKLERMRRNPHVALAFHTRAHALADRPEYVLVQGRASFPWPPDRDSWYAEMGGNWQRPGGLPRDVGPLWERWMSVYHWRVNVTIAIERIVVWPDLACRGAPEVLGAPLPAEQPAAQTPPTRGTAPRIDHAGAARRAARLPDVLLGWVGADALPVIAPVDVGETSERGIAVEGPRGLLPPGGRRAGLTAHWFSLGVLGQEQRVHTGWLDVEPSTGRAVYAPHTKTGYRMPASKLVYKTAVGFETRRWLRQGRRAGVIPSDGSSATPAAPAGSAGR
jgi:Pyridoxamine 5'-phosphate oxidase